MSASSRPVSPLDLSALGRYSPSAEGFRSPLPPDDVIVELLRRVDEIVERESETAGLRSMLTDATRRPRYVASVDEEIRVAAMPDRDFYTAWLLEEVSDLADALSWSWGGDVVRFKVEVRPSAEQECNGYRGDSLAIALARAYRDLTGHEPPPRPTEEEVRAWALDAGLFCWGDERSDPVTWDPDVLQRAHASDVPRERLMARAVVAG